MRCLQCSFTTLLIPAPVGFPLAEDARPLFRVCDATGCLGCLGCLGAA